MNELLAMRALTSIFEAGVTEFCLCPGKRNAPLVCLLTRYQNIKIYYWFEERSAAFFALGRSRSTGKPVAVVTTSGTAAAELLPATMEAYYTGVPLLLITADRPRHFRGTGAPQTAEQEGLLGRYVFFQEDLAENDLCTLHLWHQEGPAHLNICFKEPLQIPSGITIPPKKSMPGLTFKPPLAQPHYLQEFLERVKFPFIVVGDLTAEEREAVVPVLQHLNAPVFFESISGLRQDDRLASLRICRTHQLWNAAANAGYPIDGVLRIGGVPTFRFWRDLEDKEGQLEVCAISRQPFMGLSWGQLIYTCIADYFRSLMGIQLKTFHNAFKWLKDDRYYALSLEKIFQQEPHAESTYIHRLSKEIPHGSLIYLGNSLPIREWDLAATMEDRGCSVYASRGLNGIDGQLSTFLGLSLIGRQNWAIVGDLTALYDMAGPWILNQLPEHHINIVIINNGGGQIFSRMFKEKEFLHEHHLSFEPLAAMWNMKYVRWEVKNCSDIVTEGRDKVRQLIEIVPDEASSVRFWNELDRL